ncbi:uncharacterized protein LOC123559734 isoform X2 [Mercenaria mercenaria]|uniref:uncharacterized protein LOC123559734 isoform X2 n=1 Tax=Mercenaria mercenaria TaxID=6596 RepID=UPI00234F18DC|nr:uncharacterized protein LOC123559734 isoform X2 [Mercenaria mercenaria]
MQVSFICFITHEEVVMYEHVECKYNKFWVPLVWANSVLTQARKEGRIESEIGFRLIMEQIADFRDKCSLCFVYDWITIPLVYTQVVTLSVHIFFGACLIGRQYVQNDEAHPDFYIPFFTLLQFFFYMGWLKVAEQMINPFGEDDDDFDLNWLIDRHTAVAMCLADQCHANYPPLTKDAHFNELTTELPYTEASMSSKRPIFLGSTFNLERPSIHDQRIMPLSHLAAGHEGHHFGLRQRSNTGPRHNTGSVWSLFGFKPNLQRGGFGGSRDTLKSNSTMVNGHAGFGPLNYSNPHDPVQREHRDSRGSRGSGGSRLDMFIPPKDELPPEYVPLKRARATTDAPHRPLQRVVDNDRERKWSFPLSLLRKKQQKDIMERGVSVSSSISQDAQSREDLEPLLTPPLQRSRFVVESVPGDNSNIDASKQARNKQLLDKHMAYMAVSRPPVLSAIEEGNTIRSVKDLIPSPSSHSLETMDENPRYADGDVPIPTTIEEEDDDEDVFHQEKNVDRFEPADNTTDIEILQTNETFKQIMFPTNETQQSELFHVNETTKDEEIQNKRTNEVEMTQFQTVPETEETHNFDREEISASGEFVYIDTEENQSISASASSTDLQSYTVPSIVLPDDL